MKCGQTPAHHALGAALALALIAFAGGCFDLLDLKDPSLSTDAQAPAQSFDADVPDSDIAVDAGVALDSGPDAKCPSDSDGFSDLSLPGCWEQVDLRDVASTSSDTEGVAFDGRYMYFAPAAGGPLVRYDTTGTFAEHASWATFDMGAELGAAGKFAGAVYDGRYLTLVPADAIDAHPRVVRFDTTKAFADKASWETFDPATIAASAVEFKGGSYDGKYVYLVPHKNRVALRHDAQAALADGWESFSLDQVNIGATSQFSGAVFDGRHVILVPQTEVMAASFDTQGSFTAISSWSKYDTSAIDGPTNLFGGAFDGRYVFMAPYGQSAILRFDAQASFSDLTAWLRINVSEMSTGLYHGAVFDGRFMYFVPTGPVNGAPNRTLIRYDTTSPTSLGDAWTALDMSNLSGGAFNGGAYDGRFVYLVPGGNTIMTRFAARSAPFDVSLPGYFGSSF